MSKFHVEHVLEHLDRFQSGLTSTPKPEAVYLGGEEGEFFWELIGLRLVRCPVPVLVAVRFQRHELPGITHARESLASYLSSPPAAGPSSRPGEIAAVMPNAKERVPAFLHGLQVGRELPIVGLDPSLIEAAFDFRMHNPSGLVSAQQAAGSLCEYYLRTMDGHVLKGHSHDLDTGESRRGAFVAVRSPSQLTPTGVVELPTLILNRRYLALTVNVTEEKTRLLGKNWVPFTAATARRDNIIPVPIM